MIGMIVGAVLGILLAFLRQSTVGVITFAAIGLTIGVSIGLLGRWTGSFGVVCPWYVVFDSRNAFDPESWTFVGVKSRRSITDVYIQPVFDAILMWVLVPLIAVCLINARNTVEVRPSDPSMILRHHRQLSL
eukprot:SAG31_NODE_14481_length_804_cov_0.957447_1_plen_132_part_00